MSLKTQIIDELYKPARRHYPRRNVVLKGINDLYQADLVEMIPYSRFNKGYKYILTIINCFTKVADALPLKDKSSKSVVSAMKTFLLKNKTKVKHLQTDRGKEFFNKTFSELMKTHKINHYATHSEIKGAIIERFNRSLKKDMFKKFSLRGTNVWYDMLSNLLYHYNHRYHRTIEMKPIQVKKSNEAVVMRNIKKNTKPKDEHKKPRRFYLGDEVRISKQRSLFSKKYFPNWTNEVFIVHRVQPTYPETYVLRDKTGEIMQGAFYGHELLRSNVGDVYLIEKIIKKTKDKVLVRWVGFDATKDSWIDKKDIL